MGYTTKENLMEVVKGTNLFTEEEVNFIENSIEAHRELGNEAVLKLGTLNEMERMGLVGRFYEICKKHCYFPKWVENVQKGIDHI